jgi:hypothetical protein
VVLVAVAAPITTVLRALVVLLRRGKATQVVQVMTVVALAQMHSLPVAVVARARLVVMLLLQMVVMVVQVKLIQSLAQV